MSFHATFGSPPGSQTIRRKIWKRRSSPRLRISKACSDSVSSREPSPGVGLDVHKATTAPIAPVRSLVSVSRVLANGGSEPVALPFFRLDQEVTRTRIISTALISDPLDFVFEAGFGADWDATPADLRRAALILAAENFDRRHATADRRAYAMHHGVAALIQPWRELRLGARP